MSEEDTIRGTDMGVTFDNMRHLVDSWGWGCHCAPDAFYAAIIRTTREYLAEQPAGYDRRLPEVRNSLMKLLGVWFSLGRHDLQGSLFSDDPAFCWQDLGFPRDIFDELKEDIRNLELPRASE